MLGSADQWNVAVIVDSTGSMATTDSNCGGLTEFQCALSGIQFMLKDINPCFRGYSSCTPASNSNLRVALFTFPNISTGTVLDAINYGASPASPLRPTPH